MFSRNPILDSDSDEEIQEALAAGKIKPGLIIEQQKKTFIINKEGLTDKVKEFSLSGMKWIERLDLTNDPVATAHTEANGDENSLQDDDFGREMRFYRQAQGSVLEGLARLTKMFIPTKRPEDYFAEMAKSDEHMKKVRSKLLEKTLSMERSQKAKKLREMRKYGKKVQQEVLLKRQKEKKEMLDSVKKFRKGQIDKVDFLDEKIERQPKQQQDKSKQQQDKSKQQQDKKFTPNKRREYKNKKFGFGGQKKRSKYNTSESAADVSSFNPRRAHGKGGATNFKKSQRQGKSKRKAHKNKSRK